MSPRDRKFEKCLTCGAIYGFHHYAEHWCPVLNGLMEREGWKTTVFRGKSDDKEKANEKRN